MPGTFEVRSFAEFMEQALYGPAGYYASGVARTGRDGDYFTAPETGEAFGLLLKNIFMDWRVHFKADPFWIIEAGAGEGQLAKAMSWGEGYAVVERSAGRRERIRQLNLPIQIHGDFLELKKNPVEGIIFANELIDAFPVHRVRMHHGTLEEMYVGDNTRWSAPSTPRLAAYFDRLKITLPESYETEVNLAMRDWIQDSAAALSKGLIVLIDYGRPAWDYYAEERTQGTLRCFSGHRVIDPFRAGPPRDWLAAALDWTSDVDFTSLALDAKDAGLAPLAFMEMGTFLKLGVRSEGLSVKSHGPHSTPFTLHSSPFTYLLHPDGLGAQFHVLILGKNMNRAEWAFEHNRLARLGLPL